MHFSVAVRLTRRIAILQKMKSPVTGDFFKMVYNSDKEERL